MAKSAKLARVGTDVQLAPEHTPVPGNAETLLRLVQKDGAFWVDKASSSSSSKKLWLVVRDLITCGHKLSENDIIKLGRFKFRVRQMVSSGCGDQQPQLCLDDATAICNAEPQQTDLSKTLCRICLLEGPQDGDPLIRPCKCKGSIEHVHLGCLRHWIRGRLNLSDTPPGSYFFRPLPCELCKTVYPTYVACGGERVPLVEVPRTTPPFIVLENMVRDSQQHASRGLHVISLADNKLLKLGRGHESDVRIADVSISRLHATIRFHRGNFVLEDHNSKFGTLVAMKKPRPLDPGNGISIQVGRSVLSLTLHDTPDAGQDERSLRLSLLSRTTGGEDDPRHRAVCRPMDLQEEEEDQQDRQHMADL